MELLLYFGFNIFFALVMLVGLKWEPFICIIAGLIGIIFNMTLINEGVLTETLSGFSTPVGVYIYLPIMLMLTNFILGLKRILGGK